MSPDPEPEPLVAPAADPAPIGGETEARSVSRGRSAAGGRSAGNMLPRRERSGPERAFMRVVATCGVVGIGTAISAIMISSAVQGWETGLVVSIVSVVLAALLWSSRIL